MTSVKLNVNHELLANAIREHRLKRSLSQEQLALMANVSLRTVQRLENAGKCSHETLLALADVFEVDVREFTEIKYSFNPGSMEVPKSIMVARLIRMGVTYCILLLLITSAMAIFFFDHYQQIDRDMIAKQDPYIGSVRMAGGLLALCLALLSVYVGYHRKWYTGLLVLVSGFLVSVFCFALLPWIYFPEDQYSAAAVWLFQWSPAMIAIWLIANAFQLLVKRQKIHPA